jgi:hypothetical protein
MADIFNKESLSVSRAVNFMNSAVLIIGISLVVVAMVERKFFELTRKRKSNRFCRMR